MQMALSLLRVTSNALHSPNTCLCFPYKHYHISFSVLVPRYPGPSLFLSLPLLYYSRTVMVAHLIKVSVSVSLAVETDVTVTKTVVVIPSTLVLVLVPPPAELPTKLLPLWSWSSSLSSPPPPNIPGPKPEPKPVSVGAGASSGVVEDVICTGMTTSGCAAEDDEDESEGSASGVGVGKDSKAGVVWTVMMDVLVVCDVEVLVGSRSVS